MMKAIKLLIHSTGLVLCLNSICPRQGYTQRLDSNREERLAKAKINALPEVKEFFKDTKKSKPLIIVSRQPGANFKYYWIKAGISNFNQFRTSFDFYVEPRSLKVFYLDTFTNSGTKMITLQQWRNWRILPQWQKMHYYKNGKLVGLN